MFEMLLIFIVSKNLSETPVSANIWNLFKIHSLSTVFSCKMKI